MVRDLVLEVTKEMPNNATISEIIDAVLIKLSAIQGFNDIDNNKYTTQEDLLKEIETW